MAVRARGFSLGHELYAAPSDIYKLVEDHIIKASDACHFLSTCTAFARRRTQVMAGVLIFFKECRQESIMLDRACRNKFREWLDSDEENEENERSEFECRILRQEFNAVCEQSLLGPIVW